VARGFGVDVIDLAGVICGGGRGVGGWSSA